MAARLSGVQREANQLYRRLLRAAKLKDGGGWAGSTTELVRAEFRSQVCTCCLDYLVERVCLPMLYSSSHSHCCFYCGMYCSILCRRRVRK